MSLLCPARPITSIHINRFDVFSRHVAEKVCNQNMLHFLSSPVTNDSYSVSLFETQEISKFCIFFT